MEKVDRSNLKRFVLTLPWALLRFFGRIIKRFFIALGVLLALIVLAYVGFELIVETIDSRYSRQIDAYLGTTKFRSDQPQDTDVKKPIDAPASRARSTPSAPSTASRSRASCSYP